MRRFALLSAAIVGVAVADDLPILGTRRLASAVPSWPPTYNMSRSTIVMACNMSGFLEPSAFYAQFGIVDIDWSNSKRQWVIPPMRDEELQLEQCVRLKAVNPEMRCFVYRNLVKALPWYTSVREKINDPNYADWFLHSLPGGPFGNGSFYVPQCDENFSPPRCTDLYHDLEQTPGYPHGDGSCPGPCDCGGVPCGEYLWNHRNSSLREWIVNDFVMGPTGMGSGMIDGFFFDDGWSNTTQAVAPWMPQPHGYCNTYSAVGGPSEEQFHCIDDMGLTQADTTALRDGWLATGTLVFQTLAAAGAWSWAQLQSFTTPNATTCATTLRAICTAGPSWPGYSSATIHEWTRNGTTSPLPQPALDIATFLLVRGTHWWLGYAWSGCSVHFDFPAPLKVDYGVPLDTCTEMTPGVFERAWSKATARVDCGSHEGSIDML